jgi:CheY-like chemotaxis protein
LPGLRTGFLRNGRMHVVLSRLPASQAMRAAGQTVPVLAMTANASEADRDACLAAGMDGFITKPILMERLAEAITPLIDR